MEKGYIFNIQRASFDDGPGVRTVVFFKGCPLFCGWCHNPESQNFLPELMIKKENCIFCKRCLHICPNGAISGMASVDRKKCLVCGKCAQTCGEGVYKIAGYLTDTDLIMSEAVKDKKLYAKTGGGITLSGGEPLCQSEFAYELLKKSKEQGINTCVETSGIFFNGITEKSAGYIDHLLFDIKIFGEEESLHQIGTGFSKIKENLLKWKKTGINITLRSPIIPGINETADHKEKMLELQKEINSESVEYLSYHAMYLGKYDQLNREAGKYI